MSYFENRPAVVDPVMDTVLTARVREFDGEEIVTLVLEDLVKTSTSKAKEIDMRVADWHSFALAVNKLVKSL